MNTTQNTQNTTTSRFSGLRGLGRGIALGSAVAVMGLGSMSAADASAAGISHGVSHVGSATTDVAKPAATALPRTSGTQLVVRGGKVQRA